MPALPLTLAAISTTQHLRLAHYDDTMEATALRVLSMALTLICQYGIKVYGVRKEIRSLREQSIELQAVLKLAKEAAELQDGNPNTVSEQTAVELNALARKLEDVDAKVKYYTSSLIVSFAKRKPMVIFRRCM